MVTNRHSCSVGVGDYRMVIGRPQDFTEHDGGLEGSRRNRWFAVRRIVALGVTCAFVALWMLFLRPQVLGGPISNIAVSGNSMLPTFHSGDFLTVKRENSYSIGDIVVYVIPEGEVGAGRHVVHRIVGGDENGFEMKGDNNASIDLWRPTKSQIIGQAWFHIPGLARLLNHLRDPLVLAIAIAFMTLAVTLSPEKVRSDMWGWFKK